MKKLILAALFIGGILVPAYAQDRVPPPPESKPDAELTCDEADARIAQYKEDNATQKTKVDALKSDIQKAETDLASSVTDLKKCNDDIYAMINATEADVNNFRQRFGMLEGKVREMQRLNDDQLADRQEEVKGLDSTLNGMRRERIAALPEFYDKVIALARDIKGLYREKKIKGYTVGTWAENRDCLWNISGKSDIYGDPFQWPKIWQANTDKIKNPDVIQPGWVLNIPPAGPKSDDEMKAERKYWRMKKTEMATPPAQEQGTQSEAGGGH